MSEGWRGQRRVKTPTLTNPRVGHPLRKPYNLEVAEEADQDYQGQWDAEQEQ